MSSPIVRYVLFTLMLALLALPILHDRTHVFKARPLNGDIDQPVYKKWTLGSWWDGTYQDTMTTYAKDATGLRTNLTRLSNQIDFSLFKKVHANGVVIGTDGYLYEKGYIERYCGRQRLTYSEWATKVYKLKMVQDTLSKLGIRLISIQAASKASFYPEYFPEDLRCQARPVNDHEMLDKIGDSMGVNIIDFNNWFVSLKGKIEGHLFTKEGIHWSIYGATMAADSFIRYIRCTAGINIPDMRWDKGAPHKKPIDTDGDILDGLNLLQGHLSDTFYYPQIWYEAKDRVKPKMIFIADSFMWRWMSLYIPHNISTDWEFWYYNGEVWKQDGRTSMKKYDWIGQMLKSKYIVLMYSETNLVNFGSNFIENAYDHFYIKSQE